MVAVAHPHLFAAVMIGGVEPAVQDRVGQVGRRHIGAAKLGRAVAAFDATAQHMHHHLLAIADAKDGQAQFKHFIGNGWSTGIGN